MILFYIICSFFAFRINLAFCKILNNISYWVKYFLKIFSIGKFLKNKYFILREIHKLNLFTKNGNYMTINQRKIQNPDHFPICKFPSKIQWEERWREIINVCSERFSCAGGQNMIFVARLKTVKESVSSGPATQQHTH